MLFLALRHLYARPRQTLLTLLGIFFGSTAFVVISAFFAGFQGFLIDQLLNNDAHIRISAKEDFILEHDFDSYFYPDKKAGHVFWISAPGGKKDNLRIEDTHGWYRRLQADPRVTAFSPQLTSQIIITRANVSLPNRLIGSDPTKQEKVTNIGQYMIAGKFSNLAAGGNRIIVGSELLQKLGAHYGENILISNGKSNPIPFKIVGVFKIGIRALDEGTCFGALGDVQRINNTPSLVNEIALRVTDVYDAASIAKSWRGISPEKVRSWDEINANFLAVFNIQNATKYMMISVIIIVAGFGIYNILNMVVTQKRKEIAILRSMGYETHDVVFLFLIQGVILGIVGGALGLVMGFYISQFLETIPFAGGPFGSGAGHLTISFEAIIYIRAMLLSVFASSIASLLPARAAGKMLPIDIIRAGAE